MNRTKILETIAKVRKKVGGLGGNYHTTAKEIHEALDEVIAVVGEDKEIKDSSKELSTCIVTYLLKNKQQKELQAFAEKAKVIIEELDK